MCESEINSIIAETFRVIVLHLSVQFTRKKVVDLENFSCIFRLNAVQKSTYFYAQIIIYIKKTQVQSTKNVQIEIF